MNHKRVFRFIGAAGSSGKGKYLARAGKLIVASSFPNQQWAVDVVTIGWPAARRLVCLPKSTHLHESVQLWRSTPVSQPKGDPGLDGIIFQRGRPELTVSDVGGELTSRRFLAWGIELLVELARIQSGKPAQSALGQSFNAENL